ncbi:LysR family transcriptional regulator [Variovorax sp. RT4R15]|uniref:LysR family transcriptional regulator n=1 Tax=Variovorax sp. RT4R15 TaxID=3443737 RepID=UPI003F46D3B3
METIDTAFDLNALRLIVALDDTRNVTRAAELLDISQSGFSTGLARLRKRFGNPLFVRTNKGMEATPRGSRMAQTAREVLTRVKSGILDHEAFDPKTEHAHFAFSMADVAEVVFLPQLFAHFRNVAPQVTVHSESNSKDELLRKLETGRIDLALGYFPELKGEGIYQQRLYSHTYVGMLRLGHPALKRPMTKDVYVSLGHAVVTSPARTNDLFERFLKLERISRRVAVLTPHHLSLPAIISETDLIGTVPMATGAYFAALGAVELVALPFRPPVFSVQQHWHERNHQDPKHRWLRETMHRLFNDKTDRWLAVEKKLYGDIRPVGR